MADVKHAVVRTDLLAGTDVRSELISVRYQPDGEMAEIDNGNIVKLDGLEDGSRTVYKGVAPEASTPLTDVVLIASPEVMYDERKKNLDLYFNEAGKISRGYQLTNPGGFSVTAEAFDGTPAKGKVVELMAGTKLKVVDSATSGSTQVGVIADVNIVGRHTYYYVELA